MNFSKPQTGGPPWLNAHLPERPFRASVRVADHSPASPDKHYGVRKSKANWSLPGMPKSALELETFRKPGSDTRCLLRKNVSACASTF
jgi:hypothetical protein